MQIVVNTRLLIKNRLDGTGWFTYQTLKRITRQHPEVHFVFVFDRPFDASFVFSDNITPLVISPQARHPFLYYAFFQWGVKNLLNRMKPDLFLSPDGFLALGARCRQLPVIHDINFVHHPKDSRWLTSKYYNHYFPKFAAAATRIATVSEYSKNDIASTFHIDTAKIDVLYNGINDFFRPLPEPEKQATRNEFAGGSEYFVFVGSLHPRKNIVTLIRSFDMFREQTNCDIKLLLAGPGFWGLKDIHSALESSKYKTDIVFTERLGNQDLARVTASALALTFVPYYEGFGIPLVEAMACGVPVIASNKTSIPEVTADAAVLVDPFDIGGIAQAMKRVFEDKNLREELIRKGFQRQTNFSWDKTAERLWESIVLATKD